MNKENFNWLVQKVFIISIILFVVRLSACVKSCEEINKNLGFENALKDPYPIRCLEEGKL